MSELLASILLNVQSILLKDEFRMVKRAGPKVKKPVEPVDGTVDEEEIRHRIIEAAVQFMTVHGSQKLNMVEVAQLAKVARATVYNYFGSKESLIEAVEDAMKDVFFSALEKRVSKFNKIEDRIVAIAIFIRQSWTDKNHTPWYGFLSPLHEAKLIVSDAPGHFQKLSRFVNSYVVEAQKAGELRADLNPKRASDWIARIVFTFALDGADSAMNDPLEIMRFIKEHLLPGLGASKRKRA